MIKVIDATEFIKINKINNDFYDPLTQTISRKYIMEYMEYLIDNNVPFSMSIMDVDNFKLVNDNYGHNVGDEILKQFGQNLLGYSDENTLVGRYGGDEFIILNIGFNEYAQTKQFYLDFFTSGKVVRYKYRVNDNEFFITCTAGVANFPSNSKSFDELFEMADKALYRGKTKGRNCYIIYVHEKHKDIDIHSLSIKKTHDIMDDLSSVFIRGASFDSSIRHTLNAAVQTLGITGAFYLDENLNLITTAINTTLDAAEYISWGDIRQVLNGENLLQLHNLRTIEETNIKIYQYLKQFGVISLLCKTVRFASNHYGIIALTDRSRSRIWQDDEVTILTYLEKLVGICKIYGLK